MRLFVIYTLYVLVFLGVYVYIFFHIQEKNASAAAAHVRVAQLQEQNQQMNNLNSTIRNIQNRKEKLHEFFVDSERIVNFLETIEKMGTDSGADVTVRSISEGETSAQTVNELKLDLAVDGTWSHVYHFISLLENLPLKITVDTISLGKRNSQEGTQWSGSIAVRVLQIEQ